MKVWIVWEDGNMIEVCSSKEIAEHFAKKYSSVGGLDIAEYDVLQEFVR